MTDFRKRLDVNVGIFDLSRFGEEMVRVPALFCQVERLLRSAPEREAANADQTNTYSVFNKVLETVHVTTSL